MYKEYRDLVRQVTKPINDRYLKISAKSKQRVAERDEKVEAMRKRNRAKIKKFVLDTLEFLGDQAMVDGPIGAASRALNRLGYSTTARALPGISLAAQAGYTVGSYAGNQTAQNIAKGMPSSVGLDYTPQIRDYERSALGSSRII